MEDFKELNFLIEKYLISGCQWLNIAQDQAKCTILISTQMFMEWLQCEEHFCVKVIL